MPPRKEPPGELSRRERQIMDIVYRLETASVADVMKHLADAPGYSAVRTTMGLLVKKGHLKPRSQGKRYVYSPVRSKATAQRSALKNLLKTFFGDSTVDAVAALLGTAGDSLTPEELDRIEQQIAKARREQT